MSTAQQAGYHRGQRMHQASKTKRSSDDDVPWERETIDDVLNFPYLAIPERFISDKIAKYLGIRTKADASGAHLAHYFPYYKRINNKLVLSGFKKRDLTIPKKDRYHITTIGKVDSDCLLFGAHVAETQNTFDQAIWVVEGEYDVGAVLASVTQNRTQNSFLPLVVSIGLGTLNAAKHMAADSNMELLKKYPHVVVGFDNDAATAEELGRGIKKGREATADVANLLGDKIRIAYYDPGFDPCDMMKAGKGREMYWSFRKPAPYKPAGFIEYSDFRSEAVKMPEMGRTWPWPELTKLTLGRRDGEGYYFGAGVKMGKSELVNQLAHHVIAVEGRPVALFKLEEQPAMTCKKVAGKLFHKQFHNPEKVRFEGGVDVWGNHISDMAEGYFTEEELVEACDKVADNVIYFNHYGTVRWDDLKEKIRHAVMKEGCKDIVIDPLTKLTQGMTARDANEELERISDEIATMSKDLGFTYYFFCHLKAPPSDKKPHELGGKVQSNQFTGSRAMMRNCYYMLGLERNKDDLLPDEIRNMSELVLLEDRAFGRTGRVKLWYNVDTGDYLEPTVEQLAAYNSAKEES